MHTETKTVVYDLTEQDVRQAVRQLALMHPERVNPRMSGQQACAYDRNGDHCIAGQFLIDLGVVEEGELADRNAPASEVIRDLEAEGRFVNVDPQGMYFLNKVQQYVDGTARSSVRQPWGNLLHDPESPLK